MFKNNVFSAENEHNLLLQLSKAFRLEPRGYCTVSDYFSPMKQIDQYQTTYYRTVNLKKSFVFPIQQLQVARNLLHLWF